MKSRRIEKQMPSSKGLWFMGAIYLLNWTTPSLALPADSDPAAGYHRNTRSLLYYPRESQYYPRALRSFGTGNDDNYGMSWWWNAKRAPGSEFLGKRQSLPMTMSMTKRIPGSEFLGKRVPGSEFLGKRVPGSEFLGKRVPGSEFLGKRNNVQTSVNDQEEEEGESQHLPLFELMAPKIRRSLEVPIENKQENARSRFHNN